MEVWYWLLTYWVYQVARAMQALTMGKGTWEISKGHGELLVAIEKMFWLDIELPLQGFVMARPALLWFFNKVGRFTRPVLVITTWPFSCLLILVFVSFAYLITQLDIRYGAHSSYDFLHGLFLLRLSNSCLPESTKNTRFVQLYSIHHLYFMALHASTSAPF